MEYGNDDDGDDDDDDTSFPCNFHCKMAFMV